MSKQVVVGAVALALLAAIGGWRRAPVAAQSAEKPRFTDVTAASGIRFTHFKGNQGISINLEKFGPGVCVADFDGDGWQEPSGTRKIGTTSSGLTHYADVRCSLSQADDQNHDDVEALAAAIQKKGPVALEHTAVQTDHSFSDQRIALQGIVVQQLEKLKRRASSEPH